MHWTGQTAPSARIDALVAVMTDPVSGQPESKASVVALSRFEADWYGFAVSRAEMTPKAEYWAMARTKHGYRAELAGLTPCADWEEDPKRLFNAPHAEVTSVLDAGRGVARVALYEAGTLIGAVFVAPRPVAMMRDYLVGLPGGAAEAVLHGRPAADVPNPGPVLCSCLGVGVNIIVEAVETQGLISVDAIGEALGAGTNCRSCRPEIAALLQNLRKPVAAQ